MSVRGFVRLHAAAALVAAGCSLAAGQTSSSPGSFLTKSTPGFTHAAGTRNLGPENPSKIIDVSLWLKLHNRPGFDAFARDLYDRNSPQFRNWLQRDEFTSKYAPTAAEAAQVAAYVKARGLQVVTVGPANLFVRARGSVATVSKAFHMSLNRYQVKDKIYQGNASDPFIEGPTAALVDSLDGAYVYPLNASLLASPFSAPSVTQDCFPGTMAKAVVGSPGSYPFVYVYGNKYVENDAGPICGYTPTDIRAAYNLNALHKQGYDGTGQTIVIIAWCGSPTILQDANAFSARYGLPPLTTANFSIVNYPGPSKCAGVNPQINRDVEWAHVVAPGANIALVVAPSNAPQDVDQAEYYAIMAGLGNVISGGYGNEEFYQAPSEVLNENLLNEIAAVFGVSAHFAVGDYPSPDAGWPELWAPASTPFATAIGGTTLALNKTESIKWQAGWGTWGYTTTATDWLYPTGSLDFLFENGSTGGASPLFAAPPYQAGLSQSARMVPDISWLADPVTGAVVEFTPAGKQAPVLGVYGGTGLACAMFSGLWAIANQEAGSPLGQAAPYLYSMPKGTITDIVPVSSKTNPNFWIYTSRTDKQRVDFNLGAYSAMWVQAGVVNLVSMGGQNFDASYIAPGWDTVTGLGTPNAQAFADYFNPAK